MTTQVEPQDTVACWCCGEQRPAGSVVHLSSHPEVSVCLGCAHFLQRRAAHRLDELYPSFGGRMRDRVRAAREIVVKHGWHNKPFVGGPLRWLDRRLP